jgi:hypothetical protein
MNWDGKEDRRRHKRAPIRICSEFGDPSSPSRIETADFSAGGFACWMEKPIQPLTKLALRFDFPSYGDEAKRAVDCEAVVVRCERRRSPAVGWMVAAAFVGLADPDRDYIARYVQWHETVMAPLEGEESGSEAPEGRQGIQG